MDDLTDSAESSSGSIETHSDPKDRAEESFASTCVDAKRKVIIQAYRDYHLQQGRTRRSVSGSSGRLLHDTYGLDFETYRMRIETYLPMEVRDRIESSLNMLTSTWAAPLPLNDQQFVRGLGGAEDPDQASILQQFQLLFHRAATAQGQPAMHARSLTDVLRRQTKYMLYRSATEFLIRTLPPDNGLLRSKYKIVREHVHRKRDLTPPLGKTGRKWIFRYGLSRQRVRLRPKHRARQVDWQMAFLRAASFWQHVQYSLRSRWHAYCTPTGHLLSPHCTVAGLSGSVDKATFHNKKAHSLRS